jgi:hypothetical protein
VSLFGCAEHFLGPDWCWSWFDFVVVLFALLDSTMTIVNALGDGDSVNLQRFTIVRLFRLVRVARLVKLLRLKAFQELAIMINGIVGGLKTLFWAIIFLLVVVYSMGILMRQLFDPASQTYECKEAVAKGLMDEFGDFPAGVNCNRGAYTLDIYGPTLFSSVSRSMLTIFNCFTAGCEAPNGTPLLWHMWDTHGALFIAFYTVTFIFVTFGIFNLILAIFVENTLAYARSNEQKRCASRNKENMQHAKQLQQLLVKICTVTDDGGENAAFASKGSDVGLRKSLKGIIKGTSMSGSEGDDQLQDSHLHLRVDRATFECAMELPDVCHLMEALDVSESSRDKLFEVIDADGNGYLTVTELAEGIMRLRGPADKGDIVANALMLRSMQQNARRLEKTTLDKLVLLESTMIQLEKKALERINTVVEILNKVAASPGPRSLKREGSQQEMMLPKAAAIWL